MGSDKKKLKKEKKKKRKREKHDSSSESEQDTRRKEKKCKRSKRTKKDESGPPVPPKQSNSIQETFDVPIPKTVSEAEASASKSMAPMTREEWLKRQSVIKRVFDETTGRHRLIKGDGEIIEEIVSRNRHKEINQQATRGDGEFFQQTVNQF